MRDKVALNTIMVARQSSIGVHRLYWKNTLAPLYLSFFIVISLAAAPHASAAVVNDDSELILQILDGRRRNLDAIKSLQADFIITKKEPAPVEAVSPDFAGPIDREISYQLSISGDQRRNRVQLTPRNDDIQRNIYLSDSYIQGEVSRTYNAREKKGRVSRSGVDLDFPVDNALGFMYAFCEWFTLNNVVEHRSRTELLDEGLIKITVPIEGVGEWTFIVDPDKGYAIVDAEGLDLEGKLISKRSGVNVEKRSGVWIMTSCIDKGHGAGLIQLGADEAEFISTLEVKTIEINQPVPDSAFSFEFPAGTLVTDMDSGLISKVGENDALEEKQISDFDGFENNKSTASRGIHQQASAGVLNSLKTESIVRLDSTGDAVANHAGQEILMVVIAVISTIVFVCIFYFRKRLFSGSN